MRTHLLHSGGTHPLYKTWDGMKQRCLNANHEAFNRYGGRGIRICDRWINDFAAFVSDIGPRPTENHSVDRIDNDGDYEPGNCRWASQAEQNANRRLRRGETNHKAKLTAAGVVEMHRLFCAGTPAARLARLFKISKTAVRDIVRGKNWVHLNLGQWTVGT